MLKKQIILSCIESKNYNKTGMGSYVCGDFEYHVENVNGETCGVKTKLSIKNNTVTVNVSENPIYILAE